MQLTDEQVLIRDTVRSFVAETVAPTVGEFDQSQAFPEAIWDELAEMDLTGLRAPSAYGGFDADQVTASLVNEELAYGHLALATALSVHGLA
ncbi:MAG: acyl-CoA dehydrogenase family protein, partial [Natronomonas sp.]